MSIEVNEILRKCREQLQESASTQLDIEKYRDDISNECDVAITLLKDLEEAQKREIVLDQRCDAVKDLQNKMEYSNVVKEMAVVKNKIKELSNEINHSIRSHDVVVSNKKRAKIEIDRLDDILRISERELSEYGDTPTLRAETEDYIPQQIAREQSLTNLKTTHQSLEKVRHTLQQEKLEHRDLVYDLKTNIKRTRADLKAMENGTYAPDVEFISRLSDIRTAQTNELDSKRREIEDDIEQLQADIAKDTLVHDANIKMLQKEKMELEMKLSDMAQENSSSLHELESSFEKLKIEQTENEGSLGELEKRLANEQEGERRLQEEKNNHIQEAEENKAQEEKEYFAALWIQLRWKAYLKRKAMRQSSKKGKKGKKGKGKKKK